MKTSIDHKIIVITGASSGAGRTTALTLASGGACLVLAARNVRALEETAGECRQRGAEVLVIPTDVTDHRAVTALASKANDWKGKVDVWVNNAGVLGAGSFDETPWELHEKIIHTNLLGYMNGAHAILPYFKRQGYGTIINNISIGGYLPVPYGAAYSASKFALRGFSEALKGELAAWRNIHIVDLFPAFLNTPGIRHAGNYTGRKLRPAPPVSDPQVLADAVYASILNPLSNRFPGAASRPFKWMHAIAPELVTKLSGTFMRTYFKLAGRVAHTDGNLLHSVDFAMRTHGNTKRGDNGQTSKKIVIAGVLAGLAAGIYFQYLSSRK
jgi:short-subunit dehydrogenase